jgi:hypothetical protein
MKGWNVTLKKEYKEAFAEVNEILKMMPTELLNKIPSKFKTIIEEQRDKEYHVDIKEPIEEQEFKKETIAILGLIYRDFLCTQEESRILKEQDLKEIQQIQEQLEQELHQKYDSDVFKHIREDREERYSKQTEEQSIAVIQKQKWYNKLFNIIKRIFKINL